MMDFNFMDIPYGWVVMIVIGLINILSIFRPARPNPHRRVYDSRSDRP
jgi:hypothetical protein